MVWEKGGRDMGLDWRRAGVYVGSYQVVRYEFVGTVGAGYLGDIAIDDVNFGQCSAQLGDCDPVNEFKCYNGQCISADKLCDLVADCYDESDERFCEANCNFEEGMCGWHNSATGDDFDWTRFQGETASFGTGPQVDHTTLTPEGWYLYIETSSPRELGDRAIVRSHWFGITGSNCVLSIYYHMQGRTIGALALQTETTNGTTTLGNLTAEADGWQRGTWSLPASSEFRILITGYAGSSYEGDIAIDDVSIVGCHVKSSCGQNSFTCDDKTCVSADSECDFEKNCKDGSDEADCPVACDFEGGSLCGWINDHTADQEWVVHQGPTNSDHTGPNNDHTKNDADGHYLYVEASYGYPGDEARLVSSLYKQAHRITFGLCAPRGRGQDPGIQRDWRSRSGVETVPCHHRGSQKLPGKVTMDHEFVSLVSVMGESFKGDIAVDDLKFRDCALTGRATITDPPKDTTGVVGAEVKLTCGVSGDPKPSIKWTDPKNNTINGDKGRIKQIGEGGKILDITDSRLTDSGMYTCIASNSKGSATAIAHVNIQLAALAMLCCPWRIWAGYKFRYYYYYYSQGVGSRIFCCTQFNWTRRQGYSPSWMTGPESDHTTGTQSGTYIYIESSSPRKPGDMAAVKSPNIQYTGSRCFMSFWYHMNGQHIGNLEVFQLDRYGNREMVWEKGGRDMGLDWQRAGVYVGSYQVVKYEFVGTVGAGYLGDIAIDDVNFGQCSAQLGDCDPVNEFKCYNGQCISADKLCDLVADCYDESDERFCEANCNFEEGMCGWHNSATGDDFDWTRFQGETASFGTGPQVDHTTLTPEGWYLYIETSSPRELGDRAIVRSHWFGITGSNCVLSIYYHMQGRTIGALALQTETTNGTTTLGNLTAEADGWQRGTWSLPASSEFRILITGYAGSSYEGDIAIDDVSIVGCHVKSSCGQNSFTCDDKTCVSADSECDFEKNCKDGSDEADCPVACDFEGGSLCGWINDHTADQEWVVHQGPTNSDHTGPNNDHTKNDADGHYLYVEASYGYPGDEARLVSSLYKQAHRITFGLCAPRGRGQDPGIQRDWRSRSGVETVPCHHRGSQKLPGKVTMDHEFVSLVSVMGESFKGDIAVDDLKFRDCALTGRATITDPPKDTTGVVGAEVKLTCGVSGDPKPSIKWTDPKNNTINGDKGRIKQIGEGGKILDITDSRLTDSGMYTCIASNSKGSATAIAHVNIQQKAQKCPSGRYSSTGETPCNPCPVGQYQPETGKTACTKCPNGQTTDTTGATSQTQCHDQPDPCAVGTFSLSGQQPCQPCGAGRYQDGTGQKQCKICKANTYQNGAGSTACIACPQGQDTGGKTGSVSKDDCHGLCPKGEYSATGSSPGCAKCDIGSYQDRPGQKSCTKCPTGQTTDTEGSNSKTQCHYPAAPCDRGTYNAVTGKTPCTDCAAGSYQDQTGQKQCIPCKADTYQDQTASSSCVACPSGKGTGGREGSDSAADCRGFCDKGTYNPDSGSEPCKPCPIGYYSGATGAYHCNKCPGGKTTAKTGSTSLAACTGDAPPTEEIPCGPGTFKTDSGDCQMCDIGTYQPQSAQTSCIACPDGTTTDDKGAEAVGDCHKSQKQDGLSTGTLSVIGVIGGVVAVFLIVGVLLFIRHRNNTAGETPRLVLSNPSVTAADVGYGGTAPATSAPRGFMNPMYDDPAENTAQLDIELEETSHGTTNPSFNEPDFDNV
eukprot:sb/3460709/